MHQSENANKSKKSISRMLGFIEFVGTTCFVNPYEAINLEVPQLDTVDGRNPANQFRLVVLSRYLQGFFTAQLEIEDPEFVAFFYRYGFDVWMFATA